MLIDWADSADSDLAAVASQAGHSSPMTTGTTYSHVCQEDKNALHHFFLELRAEAEVCVQEVYKKT